ncbi:1,3-beta-glucan synthase [Auricularia subglabra TFB-10046 SS5]|nr:1,3-beta-glucan synthase [Auricularia subglabra TFB-10046 SS5]
MAYPSPGMPEPTYYTPDQPRWNDGTYDYEDFRGFAHRNRDSSYSLASAASSTGAGPYDYNDQQYPPDSGADDSEWEGRSYRESIGGSTTPGYTEYSTPSQRPPYPAWTADRDIPLSQEEIADIFLDLAQKFGFQRDSERNMYDFTMHQLDSRASRMSPNQALLTLHADYIGGDNANYRKWYFAAQLDLDDAIGHQQNPGMQRIASVRRPQSAKANTVRLLELAMERWREAMEAMTSYDRMRQIALYLLCWGEAAQVRFTPECLCFIFKCADDYYRSPECQERTEPVPEGLYLRSVIKPLYRFIRDQGYEVVDGKFVRREKDHQDIIGYDDVNQLFWYPEGIARIVMYDGKRLVDVPAAQRFLKFDKVEWSKTFYKTYYERRSGVHLVVNFNRIWVIHIAVYWFYTAWNSPSVYTPESRRNNPDIAMRLSATALGGAVASLIMILATVAEFAYIPATWTNAAHLLRRLLFLLAILAITSCPTIYVALVDAGSSVAIILASVQFAVAVIATVMFGIIPSGRMFGDRVAGRSRKYLASQTFTASYPEMTSSSRTASVALWSIIFACKLVESYFFLTLPFSEPIRVLVHTRIDECNDRLFGNALCRNQPVFALVIMYIMDLVLFFLDTFLWYVVWNTMFSIARSFALGLSIWTPWPDIYTCLPKRIYNKLLATGDNDSRYRPKVLVSQVWNAIIISMYREHLLSIRHVQNLLYHQAADDSGKRSLRAPAFFTSQHDRGNRFEFFPHDSEAERRLSFFAQSLTTALPKPIPIDAMPTFTVLTPHYSEKILLSLREIIREEDRNSRVTLLEYLKQLSPIEWDNFVTDTKILATEGDVFEGPSPFDNDDQVNKNDEIAFYSIGFKTASPEYTLRLRIWASLRAQTLYRTISGMMNYAKAIKLLYRVENPEVVQLFGGNTDKLERELERMSKRKFKFVVSMQRYAKFSPEEVENAEFLLRAYPDVQIAYLDEEPAKDGRGETRIFSALIDGHCEFTSATRRRPKFRIELPGNPILGDGKSDNQNHAIIFYRGEYLQLIDANQDNYLEECLKIRNVLGEFEEYDLANVNPYAPGRPSPVAIVGAREYIFSENIGILGDVAAGKEQTFGTMTHRGLAWIGGRLHYGHPDFLNALFMNTRGGVSKAQKGLHLNEDIFAGMNAFGRGGRIKHMEYYQCGKGRDLGFGTILNFQTKLGNGMGEQMLSREYYYLGTQLPIDRFLTFYYAHPGFQVNNILIILSVQIFMVCMLYIGTLNSSLDICSGPNAVLRPNGCYYLGSVKDWIEHCIISIFLVFFIAFLPLFLTELCERGAGKAIVRLAKQLGSFSYVFEVFSTQIYSQSILNNLAFGGARYIATGRGFATTRIPFSVLFSRFAGPSIYLGARTLLLLLYVTMTLWTPWLIYFWVSVLALCIAPFVFNPDQFSFMDFFIDYRELLRWMSRGNSLYHKNSWIGYCRLTRTNITGYKKKKLGHPSERTSSDVPRARWRAVLFSEILSPLMLAILFVVAYMFVKSIPDEDGRTPPSPLVRILIISLCPIVWNAAVLLIFFFVSLTMGPWFRQPVERTSAKDPRPPPTFGSYIAAIVHVLGLVGAVGFFEFLWILELWDASHAVLGLIAVITIQRAIYKIVTSLLLSREFKHDETNRAWWTGVWYGRQLGLHILSQPAREWVVKTVELSLWTSDFLITHLLYFLLSLPTLIPYIDTIHPILLFWLRPSKQIRPPVYSIRVKQQRRRIVVKYGLIFVAIFAIFAVLIVVPLTLRTHIRINCAICNNF